MYRRLHGAGEDRLAAPKPTATTAGVLHADGRRSAGHLRPARAGQIVERVNAFFGYAASPGSGSCRGRLPRGAATPSAAPPDRAAEARRGATSPASRTTASGPPLIGSVAACCNDAEWTGRDRERHNSPVHAAHLRQTRRPLPPSPRPRSDRDARTRQWLILIVAVVVVAAGVGFYFVTATGRSGDRHRRHGDPAGAGPADDGRADGARSARRRRRSAIPRRPTWSSNTPR